MKRLKRFLVSGNPFLVVLLGTALAFAAPAFSAYPNTPVKISDVPVFVDIKSLVPANVLLLADDSGSMTWTHAPDGIGEAGRACWLGVSTAFAAIRPCPDADPYCLTVGACGYSYPNPYPGSGSGYPSLGVGVSQQAIAVRVLPPPLMAAGFNKMAYNPEVTYKPPVYSDANGVLQSFPDMDIWNQVGWPGCPGSRASVNKNGTATGIGCPQGVPVTINMRDVMADFPQARTYLPEQVFALRSRYMRGATLPLQLTVENPMPMPMHYYKTNVLWCPNYLASPGTEGADFVGAASYSSACTADRTGSNIYPFFYAGPGKENRALHPSFELVVLNYASGTVTGALGTYVDENGVLRTRTHAEELTNYANWYAYYSNRTAATRTVTSYALAGIESDRWLWMGVATANNASIAPLIEVKEFDPDKVGGKYRIYKALLEYNVDSTNKGTPLKTAMHGIRAKFNTDTSFIKHSCQRNYMVALTDGGWNDPAGSPGIGNQDRTVVSAPPQPVRVFGVELAINVDWPRPIREGGLASNTLSDVSLYAWLNELRADFTDFEVDQTVNDPASWKHLNTIALTYAVEGTLPAKDPQQTLGQIVSGALDWPVPYPVRTTNPSTSHLWPTTIDDLWHATVSGFGVFTSGYAPHDFDKAIDTGHGGSAGLDVISRGGAFASMGLPLSKDLGKEDEKMYGYSASFTPNWGGTVKKQELDINNTGNFDEGDVVWDAAKTLTANMHGKAAPWNTERKIFTATPGTKNGTTTYGGNGIPFFLNDLPVAYRSTLGANPVDQLEIVNYLRGDRSLEESPSGGKYRARPVDLLGDFVHASPVVLDKPFMEYTLSGYTNFKARYQNRKRMIYAAGNDGMLHAFWDGDISAKDGTGEELWAFIPPELFRNATDKGIVNLSHSRDDGWAHYFYVDAEPRIVDVDLQGNGNGWATMLIGGMGKGGTSYYALDVTEGDKTPTGQGENLFRWTFTDDNMGYTYGRALMVRTKAWGGKWVAILPSGLNNGEGSDSQAKPASATGGDGRGRIFFVDLTTGEKLGEISTDVGTREKPSGLVHIRAFVNGSTTQLADAVYGGDQLGNFWRFDLTDSTPADWKAVKLAELTNKAGTSLPVNTEPRIEVEYDSGNLIRWIMVGTGRAYVEEDLYDWVVKGYPETIQGMFAFKDGTKGAPEQEPTPPLPSPFPYRFSQNDDGSDLIDVSLWGVGQNLGGIPADKKGWVHFLDKGYQVITNPDSLFEHVAYVANRYVPVGEERLDGQEELDLCETSPFEGILYERRVSTGVLLNTFYIRNDGLASVFYFTYTKSDGKTKAWGLGGSNRRPDQGMKVFAKDRPFPVGADNNGTKRSSIRFINR